jgi:hypothetical protein
VPVLVLIVAREDPLEQLVEVVLGARAGLHQGESGRCVGQEDVEQAVAADL